MAASLKAAREVAGDFYDIFETDDYICLVIGDVCDKGVGAALFMTLFRSLLRFTITTQYMLGTPTPSEKLKNAVTLTNNYIANTHGETGMFATVFIALLNPKDGKLTYVNAGHERPLLISDGEQSSLQSTGLAIGVMPDWDFGTEETKLEIGDFLFAYTDGVPEASNADGQFFGKPRLSNLLDQSKDSAANALDEINKALNDHIGETKQFDDITMIAVQRL